MLISSHAAVVVLRTVELQQQTITRQKKYNINKNNKNNKIKDDREMIEK